MEINFKPLRDAISRLWPLLLGFGLILLGLLFLHPAYVPIALGAAVLWIHHVKSKSTQKISG